MPRGRHRRTRHALRSAHPAATGPAPSSCSIGSSRPRHGTPEHTSCAPPCCGGWAGSTRRPATVAAWLADDPLDARALAERQRLIAAGVATSKLPVHEMAHLPADGQIALDVAHDDARAGLLPEAIAHLERALSECGRDRRAAHLLHPRLALRASPPPRRRRSVAPRRTLAVHRARLPGATRGDRGAAVRRRSRPSRPEGAVPAGAPALRPPPLRRGDRLLGVVASTRSIVRHRPSQPGARPVQRPSSTSPGTCELRAGVSGGSHRWARAVRAGPAAQATRRAADRASPVAGATRQRGRRSRRPDRRAGHAAQRGRATRGRPRCPAATVASTRGKAARDSSPDSGSSPTGSRVVQPSRPGARQRRWRGSPRR